MRSVFGMVLVSVNDLDELRCALREARTALADAREEKMLGQARLEMVEHWGPMTREEILAGLCRGPEDKPVKSVLAIVKGLREATVQALANVNTRQDVAAVLRGKLGMANEIEAMLLACWGDLERTRKAEAKKDE